MAGRPRVWCRAPAAGGARAAEPPAGEGHASRPQGGRRPGPRRERHGFGVWRSMEVYPAAGVSACHRSHIAWKNTPTSNYHQLVKVLMRTKTPSRILVPIRPEWVWCWWVSKSRQRGAGAAGSYPSFEVAFATLSKLCHEVRPWLWIRSGEGRPLWTGRHSQLCHTLPEGAIFSVPQQHVTIVAICWPVCDARRSPSPSRQ